MSERLFTHKGLGRRVSPDDKHIRKYPYRAVAPDTVQVVNHTIEIPQFDFFRSFYDQGREGACVGFGSSQCMTLVNKKFYDARWLWNEAKKIDVWEDTNPGDDNGTSVRAAFDVLRDMGHCSIVEGVTGQCSLDEGIKENRWAQTVDEVRTAIAHNCPVVIGVNWYSSFEEPQQFRNHGQLQHWIGKGPIGRMTGGHCVMLYGAYDEFDGFLFPNSWGNEYPLTFMPYDLLDRLIREDGEVGLITDR